MFSVIVPYYKKRRYIERCIDSVLKQTCTDFEIIIIDDGSEDSLMEFVEAKYKRENVKVITQENQGVSAARNTGIFNASHRFIAFLDADDYWSPHYLEKVATVLKKEEDITIIGSNYTRIKNALEMQDKELNYFLIENYFNNALRYPYFFTSGTVMARDFFEKNIGFNPVLKSGEDLDVWFRAVLSGGNAFFIKNTLVYYSDEDENQATAKPQNFNDRFIANIQANYFENGKAIYETQFYTFLSKYMYASLYIMYFQNDTHGKAKALLLAIPKNYFLADLYYAIPYRIGAFFIKKPGLKKLFRNYFKFLFRYIYN